VELWALLRSFDGADDRGIRAPNGAGRAATCVAVISARCIGLLRRNATASSMGLFRTASTLQEKVFCRTHRVQLRWLAAAMAVVDAFNAGNNVPGRHFSMMWRHLGSAHETARRPPQITLLRQPFDALGSGLRRLDATIDARGIPPGNIELRRRSRSKTRGNPQEWGGGAWRMRPRSAYCAQGRFHS